MKKRPLLIAILAVVSSIASASLMASDALNTVVVKPERGIQTTDVYSQPKSFQNNTQTFKKQDFESLPVNNAYEMLDYATGAFIQTHGRKSPYFASIRAGSNLGIIIDGAYLPAPAASKVLMQLPVTAIESMTIVRDASALNLGPLTSIIGPMTSSRTEGFIVIKTLGSFRGSKSELHARAGRFGHAGIDGTTSVQFSDEVGARVVLGLESRDGAPGYNNGHEHAVGLWKVEGYHDKMDWQVSLFHADGQMELQRGLPSSGVSDAKWRYDPLTVRMLNSQAGYYWNEQNTTSARFAYTESQADLQQYSHSKPNAYSEEKTVERFANIDVSHALKTEQNILRFGYNFMNYHNPTGMLYYPGFERKEQIQSFYLQDEYRADKFTFDVGVRTDQRTIEKGYEQTGNKRRVIENVKLDDLLTAAIGGTYALSPDTLFSLRTLYTEQQPISVYTNNNAQLLKEKRLRGELGWSQSWHPLFNTTLTGFIENLDDAAYIDSQIPDPNIAGENINVYGNASWQNRGVELEIKGRYKAYGYEVGLSKVDPGATPSGVVNVPKELLRARAYYHGPVWTVDMGARSMDKYYTANKAGSGFAGDFVTYDASVGRHFKTTGATHKVSLYAKNVTDEKYETMYGFPNEGLSYGVDYRVQF